MEPAGQSARNDETRVLRAVVGAAAIAAPALHSITDVLELLGHGFSPLQLRLNYLAFLPMPWLLLGIHAAHRPRPGTICLIGALLYGVAFTYFIHTTLYALAERVPDYATLWGRLGAFYTVHGALMILGGLLFAWSVWRAGWLPRFAILLFAAGLIVNLALALLPAPEILQTLGTAIRNLGLMAIGLWILRRRRETESTAQV